MSRLAKCGVCWLLVLCGCSTTSSTLSGNGHASRGPGAEAWQRLERGDPQGALTLFDQVPLESQAAQVHGGRARALVQLGRTQEAQHNYLEALRLEPQNAEWHMGLGLSFLSTQDLHAAIGAFDAALVIDAGNALAYFNRGFAYLSLEEHERALADYNRAVSLDPQFAEAYNSRGVVRTRLGQYEAAVVDFHHANSLRPVPGAHGNCAAAYYAMGETQRALAQLNTAIRLERQNPLYHLNRGRIYLDLGEPKMALRDLETAYALDASSIETQLLLDRARGLTTHSNPTQRDPVAPQ